MRPDTFVYRDEQRDWLRASDLPELKAILSPRAGWRRPPAPSTSGPSNSGASRCSPRWTMPCWRRSSRISKRSRSTSSPRCSRRATPGDAMYSVLEGEMRAREFRGGREVTILTLGVGETFGELALLIEGERASDIVANETSTLLKLPGEGVRPDHPGGAGAGHTVPAGDQPDAGASGAGARGPGGRAMPSSARRPAGFGRCRRTTRRGHSALLAAPRAVGVASHEPERGRPRPRSHRAGALPPRTRPSALRFMAGEQVRKEQGTLHEPALSPSLSRPTGEGARDCGGG